MENRLYQKPCPAKAIKRLAAVLMAGAMLFGLCACGGRRSAELKSVTVERELGPRALQTANEATALALRYYIYARLKTEAFVAADFRSMPAGAFADQMDELVAIWQTADVLASGAEEITDQAVLLLDGASTDQAAAAVRPRPQSMALAGKGSNPSALPLAAGGGRDVDPETWAENLTKQYDALRGAQRYKQLAQQLGTDTKTAVEQMALAQKIIRNAADVEEAQAEVNAYTRSIQTVEGYKTASKVGLFVGATVATGGGSLASLAGSSMSLGTAGTVLVGGVDCVVDVGKTASSIILGEEHQVTVDFQKAGDVIQPVSMVMGLVTINPNSTVEQIAFLGEAMMEWCSPGKITAMGVEITQKGNALVLARLIELMRANTPDIKETLEGLKLRFPKEKEEGISLSELILANVVGSEDALERMQRFKVEISELTEGAEGQSPPPQETASAEQGQEASPGKQPEKPAAGSIASQEMAGTYSGSAALQHVEEDVEAPDSLPVTLQLNESGTGTVNVYGYGGEAQYVGSTVTFSVTMKEDGAAILCVFEGKASRSGSQIVISGNMRLFLAGVAIATYSWTAQK